ncbi:NAD-binding protein, partial [Ostertagia ostertagi]
MDVVAVTGSSGLVGRYVVERLIKCGRYKEIRLIDRIQRSCAATLSTPRPVYRQMNVITAIDAPISYENHVLAVLTLRHYSSTSNCRAHEGALEQALHGCNAVVHCSHAPLPWTYSDKKTSEAIWRDNLSATEMLVDKMIQMGVKNLVYVGDAYSALPIEDNYGLGEMVFNTYPADYILGEYGESRTRGEMYARKATANGSSLKGVFLRPVHVHAEEASSSWRSLMKMAENGNLPYIDGERRGMHQFVREIFFARIARSMYLWPVQIYAGNLAAIVDRCLGFLATNPDRVNTEIIYCLDDTNAIPIRQKPSFITLSSHSNTVSSRVNILKHSVQRFSLLSSHFTQVSKETLSYPMFRFLFAKTIGFSDRKQRLLLDHLPRVNFSRTHTKKLKSSFSQRSLKKNVENSCNP